MKRIITVTLCMLLSFMAHSQEQSKNKSNIKTGWNFGPFPAVSYNSDLGFQYGALCDIFYYGDGSQFPDYRHKMNVELSRYTKGETVAHIFYDSKYLLPKGMRVTAAVSYLDSQMSPFYGFNGYASPYNDDLTTKDSENYNPSFYAIDRRMTRALLDIHMPVAKNFTLMTGLTFWDIATDAVQLKKYRGEPSLYNIYRQQGLIKDGETSGSHLDIKLGMIYDTRDHELAPNSGYCFELVGLVSPDLRGSGNSFSRVMSSWRHFIPVGNRVVLGYRVAAQETFGNAPFYMMQTIQTLYLRQIKNEGLGGKNTVRGVLQNRMLGRGYAWANLECRVRLADFRFINQMWYLATNPFVDMGIVMDCYRPDEQKAAAKNSPEIYSGEEDSFHGSAGLGLKLVMNQNFILSAEWGKPFDKRDGKSGMSIGLNYIF